MMRTLRDKALFYLEGLPIGGGTITALDIAAAVRDDWGWDVVVYSRPGPGEAYAQERDLRCIPALGLDDGGALRRVQHLRTVCRAERPRIVHAWDWKAVHSAHLGPWLLDGVPVLGHITEMELPPGLPPEMHLSAVTQDIAASRRGNPDRTYCVDPPINDDVDDPVLVDPAPFIARHGRGGGTLRVVIVSRLARLMKEDGIRRTIHAVGELQADHDIELLVVGDGDAAASLQEEAATCERQVGRAFTTFVGAMLDPRQAYAAADIVVGMGTSAVRAMAFEKPVVVVGSHGFCDVFEARSADALIGAGFYGGDPEPGRPSLRDHLEALARDPARRTSLGVLGAKVARERFGIHVVAAHVVALYERAIRWPERRTPIAALRVGRDLFNVTRLLLDERRGLLPVVPVSHVTRAPASVP